MGNSVTRFPGGLTNVAVGNPLQDYPAPDPTRLHVFFDDFDKFTAGDWTITTTEGGTGAATEALTDGDGGLLLITNDDADNDLDFFQKVGESFKFAAGKQLWYKMRFKVSEATQSDFVVGLVITDTTLLDVTDGVFFQKDDGDALLDFHVEKNNTATSAAAIATVVDDTFLTVGFHYDGVSKITYYVNDVGLGYSAVTNLPDDEELTVTFGFQNGSAGAKTMTVDYVFAAKER